MNKTVLNISRLKTEKKMDWDALCKKAHIRLASWMCGVGSGSPTESELQKIAKALDTSVEALKEEK